MCNNVLVFELCPYNVSTTVQLSAIEFPVTEENNIERPWWHWLLGGIILVGTFVLVAATCGAGAAFLSMAAGAVLGGSLASTFGLSLGEGMFFGSLLGGLAAAIFNLLSIVATALGDFTGTIFAADKVSKAIAVASGMNAAATATVTVTGAQAIAAVGTLAVLGLTIVFASNNRPHNNQVQNKQFRDAARQAGYDPNDPDVMDTLQEIHQFIRENELDLGWKKLVELIKNWLG